MLRSLAQSAARRGLLGESAQERIARSDLKLVVVPQPVPQLEQDRTAQELARRLDDARSRLKEQIPPRAA